MVVFPLLPYHAYQQYGVCLYYTIFFPPVTMAFFQPIGRSKNWLLFSPLVSVQMQYVLRPVGRRTYFYHKRLQEQKRCLPMTLMRGRDQIQALVAVAGLK